MDPSSEASRVALAMARLSLTLLGGFQARLEPGGAVSLPTRKAQALLAYLALPLGQAHPRDKLAALLWGGIRRSQPAAACVKRSSPCARRSGPPSHRVSRSTATRSPSIDAPSASMWPSSSGSSPTPPRGRRYPGGQDRHGDGDPTLRERPPTQHPHAHARARRRLQRSSAGAAHLSPRPFTERRGRGASPRHRPRPCRAAARPPPARAGRR